jgi:spermidine synthase
MLQELKKLPYPHYYLVILTTGACSLIYQVVWQRYLGIMLGSEARSATLIVSIFLLGLAVGYYLFGILSNRPYARKQLLKLYGKVEFVTGVWAVIFPNLFMAIFQSEISASNSFILHLLLTVLFVFFPAILMGATVPVMTSVIPNQGSEINNQHAYIYGVNTIGAFIGVVVSGFWMIETLGLDMSLMVTGFINILVSLVYMGNKLAGDVHQKSDVSVVETSYGFKSIILLATFSGITSLSLEILWIRLTSMIIGSNIYVFPIILSLFVLGLGYGSLTVKELSQDYLKKQLWRGCVALGIIYFLAPYLPVWVAHIRIMLIQHPVTYRIYYGLVYLILGAVLLSFVIPLGRLLPLGYALLPKNKENFGFRCALLYFFNTAGTFVGAVFFSYLLLYVFDIPAIYKMNLLLLVSIWVYFIVKDQQHTKVKNVFLMGLTLLVLVSGWNRDHHLRSPFRSKGIPNGFFTGLWTTWNPKPISKFFTDGPNTSVGVLDEINHLDQVVKNYPDIAIMVNGKSDSSTVGDYATTSMISVLPYLYSSKPEMTTAMIGVGTGVSAGVFTKLPAIKAIDVIEISPAVMQAQKYFDFANESFWENPKVTIHEKDAFQYLRSLDKKLDIIASEPTNPWVVGVENLYSDTFYQLLQAKLNDDGILAQWLNLYDFDDVAFISIMKNIKRYFKFVEVVQTIDADIVILASNQNRFNQLNHQRYQEKIVQDYLIKNNILDPMQIELMHILSNTDVDYLADYISTYYHDVFHPKLSYNLVYAQFAGETVIPNTLIDPYVSRHLYQDNFDDRYDRFKTFYDKYSGISRECRPKQKNYYANNFCWHNVIMKAFNYYQLGSLEQKVKSYSILRKKRFVSKNLALLEEWYQKAMATKNIPVAMEVQKEFLKEWDFKRYDEILAELSKKGHLAPHLIQQAQTKFMEVQKLAAQLRKGQAR